jgi:hypothetical protein
MEKKKWGKITALGTAALMLGATLTGALAVENLATFPAPFIADGVLQDTVIVVGEDAKVADVLGAVDIAASLQAQATTPTEAAGVVVTTIDEGMKVEKSGDYFNLGDDVENIQAVYDDNDLDLLEAGEFEDTDFTQTLTISSGAGVFEYSSPGKVDKTEFDAGYYLKFLNNQQVYSYALTMDSTHTYDTLTSDIETKTIDIQGNTYTITDVKYSSTTGAWTEITLLAGETVTRLNQDVPLTVGDVTITVIGTNEGGDECTIDVSGTTLTLAEGETEEVQGLQVGLTDAFAGHNIVSNCEITVGAREVKLVGGDQVKVNGEEIKGSAVTIVGNQTATTFDSFTVTYTMDDDEFPDDEYGPAQYKMPGEEWEDPVFGNFKFVFDSTSAKFEEMAFVGSSDDATFTFNNLEGSEVVVDFYLDGSNNVILGEETGPLMYTATANTTDVSQAGSTVESAVIGTYPEPKLWYVLSNGELHLLEFDDYDDDTNKIEFNDLSTGKSITTSALSAVIGDLEDLTVGSLGTAQLGYHEASDILYFNATGQVAQSEYGLEITPANGATNATLTLTSPDEDSDVQEADNTVLITAVYDTTDEEVDVATPYLSAGAALHASSVDKEYSDSDVAMYSTVKGLLMEYDDKEDRTLDLWYPEEDLYANVFIAPVSGVVSSSAGAGSGVDVNAFELGLAVFDSEAGSMDKNMIVVGGPCVNSIAADLMESGEDCAAGFEAGKAMLKYFDRSGKAALLVAGYGADDSRGAAYALADPDAFSGVTLSGSEMELVVTSMSEITGTSV